MWGAWGPRVQKGRVREAEAWFRPAASGPLVQRQTSPSLRPLTCKWEAPTTMPAAPSPAGEGALNQGCEAGGALRRTWLPARDRTLRPWKSPAFRQLEPAAASRSPSPEQMAPRPAALTETALGRRGDRQGALRLAPQQLTPRETLLATGCPPRPPLWWGGQRRRMSSCLGLCRARQGHRLDSGDLPEATRGMDVQGGASPVLGARFLV